MKQIIIIAVLFLSPSIVWGYSIDNLEKIELDFSFKEGAYRIHYYLDDGRMLRSNLSATAQTEYKAIQRLYNVTKNTPGFLGIPRYQIEELFDYDSFNTKREAMKILIDQISRRLADLYKPDVETILRLQVMRSQL